MCEKYLNKKLCLLHLSRLICFGERPLVGSFRYYPASLLGSSRPPFPVLVRFFRFVIELFAKRSTEAARDPSPLIFTAQREKIAVLSELCIDRRAIMLIPMYCGDAVCALNTHTHTG